MSHVMKSSSSPTHSDTADMAHCNRATPSSVVQDFQHRKDTWKIRIIFNRYIFPIETIWLMIKGLATLQMSVYIFYSTKYFIIAKLIL